MRRRAATRQPRLLGHLFAGALLVAALPAARSALAVTAQSPEVVAMVDRGLKYLETHSDDRLGAKCLIGLAFHKRGMPESHHAIRDAVDACTANLEKEKLEYRIYSKALAVIFLTEINAKAHRKLIEQYAQLVEQHQMPHGGFGYKIASEVLGDTSQTQYAALAYWEMLQSGLTPDVKSVEQCANWLVRTQAPDGAWAYKGQDPGKFERMEQSPKSPCMLSAGLSGVLICGNMLGLLQPSSLPAGKSAALTIERLPPAMKRADLDDTKSPNLRSSGAVQADRLKTAAYDGRKWFDKNFDVSNGGYYPHYALYALERYKSFEEYLEGDIPEEPEWYNRGYEFLKASQQPDGSWAEYSESSAPCSTAFSILFLLRSTQASIRERLGEGTLVGGRGLPRDLSKVKVRGGRIVVEQRPTEIDELLDMLEKADDADGPADPLADILGSPGAIVVENVGASQVRQLERLARAGKANERVVAVEALSKLRRIDEAPTLIFALSDPDRRVVRAARDGLQSVSREFEGFGPGDNFDESERQASIDKWKAWYLRIRPDAVLP